MHGWISPYSMSLVDFVLMTIGTSTSKSTVTADFAE